MGLYLLKHQQEDCSTVPYARQLLLYDGRDGMLLLRGKNGKLMPLWHRQQVFFQLQMSSGGGW